jgi:hypothetical protein
MEGKSNSNGESSNIDNETADSSIIKKKFITVLQGSDENTAPNINPELTAAKQSHKKQGKTIHRSNNTTPNSALQIKLHESAAKVDFTIQDDITDIIINELPSMPQYRKLLRVHNKLWILTIPTRGEVDISHLRDILLCIMMYLFSITLSSDNLKIKVH